MRSRSQRHFLGSGRSRSRSEAYEKPYFDVFVSKLYKYLMFFVFSYSISLRLNIKAFKLSKNSKIYLTGAENSGSLGAGKIDRLCIPGAGSVC